MEDVENVLVTGISGFVGKNLYHLLQNRPSFKLVGVSTRPEKLREELSELHALSYEALFGQGTHNFAHYIHLAGKAHDLKKTSQENEYFDVNYGLTKKLYDFFLEDEAAKTFTFVSTVKAVRDNIQGVLVEETICTPLTAYGRSKMMAEEYILNNIPPEDKKVYILRPCMIHGPGNKGNLNLLYKMVQKGIPYPLAAFENQRSFLSVENLLFVLERILSNAKIPAGVYNVSDDEPLSTNEVIKVIGKAGKNNVRLWSLSPMMLKGIALIGDKLHLPLTSERLQKLTESYIVDNAKIKKALNISSFPVSSRDGLLTTIRSFQN